MFPVVVAAMHLPMRYVLHEIPGDKPAIKAPTENDMSHGSAAEARS
jgi:hypothetical protein